MGTGLLAGIPPRPQDERVVFVRDSPYEGTNELSASVPPLFTHEHPQKHVPVHLPVHNLRKDVVLVARALDPNAAVVPVLWLSDFCPGSDGR